METSEMSAPSTCVWLTSLGAWWIEPAIASFAFALWTHIFRAAEGGYHKLWGSMNKPPHLLLSLFVYWAGILVWIELVPPPPQIPHGCPSDVWGALRLLAEVCAGIVAYDFTFFWLHLAMHTMPRTVGRATNHARHHELDGSPGNVTHHEPWETCGRVVHHSLADGMFQVLVNILVQRYTPWGVVKSRLSRWFHNVIVTFLLTEAHTTAASPRIARRFFAGVRDHHLHHKHRGPPYQQFFSYLDRAMLLYQSRRRHGREAAAKLLRR